MKHRKSLLLSTWGITVGIILLISGSIVSGMGIIFHWGGDNTAAHYEYTTGYYVGVGMVGAGIITLILGVLGIVTTYKRTLRQRTQNNSIGAIAAPIS